MTLSSSYPSTKMTSTPVLYDYLQNALTQISSSMTANLPTLNSSRTEFLLIGLSKQLAKINNSSLNTTHAVRNLSFIWWAPHLSWPNLICLQIPLLPLSSASYVSVHVFISKQPPLLPLPLSTPCSTTATLFLTTCPSRRSPRCNTSRIVLRALL